MGGGRGEGAHGPLCINVEVMHGIYYMPLGSFVRTVAHSQMIMQVLWLGLSESASMWKPESCLPPNLIADFEAGLDTEAEALTERSYCHSSTTLTVSTHSLAVKRRKTERLYKDDLEG